jgi:hypothetical protein
MDSWHGSCDYRRFRCAGVFGLVSFPDSLQAGRKTGACDVISMNWFFYRPTRIRTPNKRRNRGSEQKASGLEPHDRICLVVSRSWFRDISLLIFTSWRDATNLLTGLRSGDGTKHMQKFIGRHKSRFHHVLKLFAAQTRAIWILSTTAKNCWQVEALFFTTIPCGTDGTVVFTKSQHK